VNNTKGLPEAAERRAALDARYPDWTPMTLAQAFDSAAEGYADRPFVITPGDRVLSYREMQEWSRRLAAGLVALGVQAGDHVALVCANYPEYVAAKCAIARAGAVCVPINYLFRAAELGYVLAQSNGRVLITMDRYRDLDYLAALDQLAPGWESAGGGGALPRLEHVVVFSPSGEERAGAMTLDGLASYATDEAREEVSRRESSGDPDGVSDILYTSGTTGKPKGVLFTHQRVLRMAYSACYQRALEDGRRVGFPMPMYHVFGYVECLMAVQFVGGAIVPQVTFDARELLSAADRHGINEIVGVPAVTLPLIAEARDGDHDLSSVHTIFSSGGASPPTLWEDIIEAFGDVEMTTGYGMTETTAATTCTMPEGPHELLRTTNGCLRYAGAAGEPGLGGHLAEYKTIDLVTGDDLPPGEQGHLLVRGPVVTPGYYDKPDETALAFTDDGWMRTGDIGTIDSDGFLRLTGRLKESFRVGGEMVMPAEVEGVLGEHERVREAHVVGLPHPRMGEVACAWVVASDPSDPPTRDELDAHCNERLARFKVPRHMIFTSSDELPLTATGRVQKFKLVEMSQDRLSQPA
jgi:fatty-acyl-CoA synthase